MTTYGVGLGALLAKHAGRAHGAGYRKLQSWIATRALVGALATTAMGRLVLARRYMASWRGRREGWRRWHSLEARP